MTWRSNFFLSNAILLAEGPRLSYLLAMCYSNVLFELFQTESAHLNGVTST